MHRRNDGSDAVFIGTLSTPCKKLVVDCPSEIFQFEFDPQANVFRRFTAWVSGVIQFLGQDGGSVDEVDGRRHSKEDEDKRRRENTHLFKGKR